MSIQVPQPVRITVVRNDERVPLGAWQDWPGAQLRVVNVQSGEPLPTVREVGDALVVLGGSVSVYSEAPWLAELRTLLADAVAADVPVLALCLGAQLLAVATGGRVEVAAPPGLEAGVTAVFWRSPAASDPVLGAVVAAAERGRSRTISWHYDAIVDLPDGATWLASSNQYPFQAFRVGSALGLQFHPEATRDLLRRWSLDDPQTDPEVVLARFDEHAAEIDSVGQAIAQGFVASIRARDGGASGSV